MGGLTLSKDNMTAITRTNNQGGRPDLREQSDDFQRLVSDSGGDASRQKYHEQLCWNETGDDAG